MLILLRGFYRFPSPKTAFFLASLPQTTRACIGCMILHESPAYPKEPKPRATRAYRAFVSCMKCA